MNDDFSFSRETYPLTSRGILDHFFFNLPVIPFSILFFAYSYLSVTESTLTQDGWNINKLIETFTT
jgi:hypothetical protein